MASSRPQRTFHDTADTRRPRFSFFLTNNVKKPTEKIPSPDPTSLSNLAQASHQSKRKISVVNVQKVSFKTRHLNERLSRQKQPRRPVRCRRYRRMVWRCQRGFSRNALFLLSICNHRIKTPLDDQACILKAVSRPFFVLFCRHDAAIGESMVNEW